MKLWSTWLQDVRPHVPGCPDLLAEHELRRCAQEFFRRSRAWQVRIPAAIAVTAGTSTVTIATGDAAQDLLRVESIRYDGKELEPVAQDALDKSFGDDWSTHTGFPNRFLQLTPGSVVLYPVPDVDAVTGVTARLSVTPSESSTGLPDDLAIKFYEPIHIGARSRLMLYPGKPWTNYDLAAVYGNAFTDMADAANVQASMSFSRARLASRATWF